MFTFWYGGPLYERYTSLSQSLLPCSIIVVWDEAPLKEPIRHLVSSLACLRKLLLLLLILFYRKVLAGHLPCSHSSWAGLIQTIHYLYSRLCWLTASSGTLFRRRRQKATSYKTPLQQTVYHLLLRNPSQNESNVWCYITPNRHLRTIRGQYTIYTTTNNMMQCM